MYNIILFACLLSFIECYAQYNILQYHYSKNLKCLFLALLFYVLLCVLLLICYNYANITLLNGIWSGISIILALAIIYVFSDNKITYYELLGLLLITFGIAIITLNIKSDSIYEIKSSI